MERKTITAALAPAAVGPYSHAVQANGMLFTAGQIPLVPETGKLIDGDIDAQTEQVLRNLKAVLEAGGSSLDRVVKTTVFLADMSDFAAVNAVYARWFWKNPPARSAIQVAALPLGARVEIEAVALV
jgi:2-iminobutanoate/2-iminopropanoate deaminase